MTQDEIIEMARQAGINNSTNGLFFECDKHDLSRFAKLVEARTAAKEREACAKIIDDSYETTTPGQGIPEDWLLTLSEAIRARAQADGGEA
jgi:hypothetical protein